MNFGYGEEAAVAVVKIEEALVIIQILTIKLEKGGAGGLVYVQFEFAAGTQILLTVGGGGRGAGKQGNGTRSNGGYNGGGLGAVSNNDQAGGGGGFTGLFLGNGNSHKTQARAIAISPGGGGGAGGPGYQNGMMSTLMVVVE